MKRAIYIPKWSKEVFEIVQRCLNEGKKKIERDADFVRILKGSRSKRIIERGYHKTFSTYGILKSYKSYYLKAVAHLLKDTEVEDLVSYVVLVGKKGNERNIGSLLEFLPHKDGNIRRLTCSALGKIGSSIAEKPLIGMLFDSKPQVRQYAIKALGKIGTSYSFPILERISMSQKEKDYNKRAAKEAVKKITGRGHYLDNDQV